MNQPTDKSRWDFTFEVTPYDRKVFLFEYALACAEAGKELNVSGQATGVLQNLELWLAKQAKP